jgi:hypothetical protein
MSATVSSPRKWTGPFPSSAGSSRQLGALLHPARLDDVRRDVFARPDLLVRRAAAVLHQRLGRRLHSPARSDARFDVLVSADRFEYAYQDLLIQPAATDDPLAVVPVKLSSRAARGYDLELRRPASATASATGASALVSRTGSGTRARKRFVPSYNLGSAQPRDLRLPESCSTHFRTISAFLRFMRKAVWGSATAGALALLATASAGPVAVGRRLSDRSAGRPHELQVFDQGGFSAASTPSRPTARSAVR